MKKIILLLLFLIGLVALVAKILGETGFFRTIVPTSQQVLANYQLPGVEDMAISHQDSFLILSSANRQKRRDHGIYEGGLYLLNLKEPNATPIALSSPVQLYPHGISLKQVDSTSYLLWVINHIDGKHSIEEFKLNQKELTHLNTYSHEALISPNDIHGLGEGLFYFTNDHGNTSGIARLAEDYLGWGEGNVVYYDGKHYHTVANEIAYPNGINTDDNHQYLFIASSRSFAVLVFEINADGSLELLETINATTGVDNINIAKNGTLWIGCHPQLLTYSAYSAGNKSISPTEVITIKYRGKGDFDYTSVYRDTGDKISGSSVAVPFANKIFIGNVMDDHFIAVEYESR